MMSRPIELRTRPYTPSRRYWPRPGTTPSRRVASNMTAARPMVTSTMTTIGRVTAKAPSPTSGCQKSGALGGTNSSAAETTIVTTQPPLGTARGGCVLRPGGPPRAVAAWRSSRAAVSVTDPNRGDRSGHPQDQGQWQHPHLMEGLAEPPGRQAEDQHRRQHGAQGVPALAQMRPGDHLVVHRRRTLGAVGQDRTSVDGSS